MVDVLKTTVGLPVRFFLPFFLIASVFAADSFTVAGVVRDPEGAVVVGADVSLLNAQQAIIATAKTDANGHFRFAEVPTGSHLLVITSRGFAERRLAIRIGQTGLENLEITLEPQLISEHVTVTANPGMVEDREAVSQQVNIINEQTITQRAKAVVAQIATEEAGVHLQRTSSTVAGVFVRGLTGNKVNVFIDGVRYSTSAARGGINTFLDLIEPSNLKAVEILRGPNSAQYGGDAIGGSLQFLSRVPAFSADGAKLHGQFGSFFNSADVSFGSSLRTSYATPKVGLLTSFAGRRINTLRPGGGFDSHSAVTRFFGLRSDMIFDDRLPDTAFTQYGGMIKMHWSPTVGSQVITYYSRGQQDGGKRYDQLLGGDGNLVADLRNLMLDLFYVRYDRVRLGWFDHVTAVYSFNSQREERANQGGNGNPRATITHEYERTNAHGFQAFTNQQWGTRQNFLLGAEYYHERINSPSFGFNPATNSSVLRRPRVPDDARYQSGGVYVQDVFEAIPNKLRLIGNLRYSAASYRARGQDSPLVNGQRLWPDDSLRVSDVTFRGGIVVTPVNQFSLSANISRGFRAPHMTDLGTLGLTGSGFEIAAPDVAGLGAMVGSTADSNAVSTGRPVTQVEPETSLSYEVGARYHTQRLDTDFAFFVNDINDNITKQALMLPPGAVGRLLGGQPITAQTPNGVVFVAASTNPVLVRINFDDARLYGFEHTFDVSVSSAWSVGTIFTYVQARDKRTNLPPNIEGGTPAPDGYLKIRYAPSGRRLWIEPYIHAVARQKRLSSLDLEDRRTGATRSRSSIRNFFLNGATARGLVNPGADGQLGTADDRLKVTGETVAQIQDRVLGSGVNSAPLLRAIPGYITFNLRGGLRFGEQHEVLIDVENIGDRNYRGISWGLDGPGRSFSLRYNFHF
jgi:hemoglobin/transferrin/lactoferrin receptor protein